MTHIRHYVLTLGRKNPSPAGDGWYCAIMQEIDQFRKEATSGDYDHLLQTCMRWVDVS